jgi:hypothetical protein
MRIHITDIPDKIMNHYNLHELADEGWVYVKIQKGMYGLPQAGILANKLLMERLHPVSFDSVSKTSKF